MELPTRVEVYNQLLGLSGIVGTLMAIRQDGCYELRLHRQGKLHLALLPIDQTGIVFVEPEPEVMAEADIER
ncbi:MAG: hypothetical protein H6Q02_89 [Acidobacteria bacterium]|jgi:hypothetical protein|nr:hypothetical protein [Acidobacteriota bacterium]